MVTGFKLWKDKGDVEIIFKCLLLLFSHSVMSHSFVTPQTSAHQTLLCVCVCVCVCVCAHMRAQWCPTLCETMDGSPLGFSVHRIS